MKKAGKRKVKAIGVISGLIMTISFFSMASNPLSETGETVVIIAAATMILSGIIFSLAHTYLDYIKERK
ncbi:MAG: hypothetical protein PHP35_01080 [Candidatus Colwellbacteria bacterium]|nr:hypothetical protein [Candidatus Colwellbacteria bacterium]